MFLNYFALGVLIFVFLVLFYGIIAIHDIPYNMAKKRNHPHADAIHTAGWISLFTLHAIWPFLWIWATLYQPERGWGMQSHIMVERKGPRPRDCRTGSAHHPVGKKDWMGRRKQITPPFRRFNHGFVDSPDLCGLCLGHL
ncbi:Inner membrane protein yiaW [Citrobacter freundii]|nr:Inner membrane protein yiaW [Citrobacter freundii]